MKQVSCSKFIQDRNAERDAAKKSRNNGSGSNKATISTSASTSASSMQANPLTSLLMARYSQPRALLAVLPFVPTQAPTITILAASTNGSWLSKEEMERLKKFDRYYNCKHEGHAAWRCTQPAQSYSAVNAQLQEVELVAEAELGKK